MSKTIIILWIDTDIWWKYHDMPGVVGIKRQDFDPARYKLFDPFDILINCLYCEEWDLNKIYNTNVIGNIKMQQRSKLDDAHYIRFSTPRIWDWKSGPYYEDSKKTWDSSMYWNTMVVSEEHIEYPKTTVIRWIPTQEQLEYIIENKIYWKINIPGKYWEHVLLSNNKLC